MRKSVITLGGTAILMAVVAGSAFAQAPEGQRGPGRPGGGPGGPGGFMRMMPIVAALDADEDGEISTKEIENAVTALKGLDKDKNGKLTQDEMRPDFGDRGGPGGPGAGRGPGAPGGPGAGGPGGPGGFAGRGGPPSPEAFVQRAMQFDADKDGKLDKVELGKMAEQMGRGFGARGGDAGGERPRGGDRPRGEGEGEGRPDRPQRPGDAK